MTKEYTEADRQHLYNYVMDSRLTRRIFDTGIEATAEAKPNALVARALGFNKQGKFNVNGERAEGSKNKWQRYFSTGCPELLEYIARVCILEGEEFSVDSYFLKPVERNKAGEVHMPYTPPSTETPSAELVAWVAQLPDWGELYTPKGFNFYILYHLYYIDHGENPNHKQLIRACDSYDSPYKVRLCQGTPQNDPAIEFDYAQDLLRLTGLSPEAEVTKAPEPESTDPYGDYLAELQAEATRREVEKLQGQAEALAEEIRGVDISKLVLPTTPSELRIFNSKLMGIKELEDELYPVSKEFPYL